LAYLMVDGMPVESTNEDKSLRLSTCGFSNSQIAEILSIPVGSVRSNLYQARKKVATSSVKPKATGRATKRRAPSEATSS
jgi:DNA-binding NarL/FixJ family response regulator